MLVSSSSSRYMFFSSPRQTSHARFLRVSLPEPPPLDHGDGCLEERGVAVDVRVDSPPDLGPRALVVAGCHGRAVHHLQYIPVHECLDEVAPPREERYDQKEPQGKFGI